MHSFSKTLAAAALVASAIPAAQAGEVSGNVALANNYIFRGVSQTDNSMALQGGFDYDHGNGFSVGTWASNVDSQFFNNGTDPQLEWDLYAGYAGEISNGIGYNLGAIRYVYPGSSSSNTTEFYVGGDYKWFNATFYYSPELSFIGVDESAWYLNVGAEYELPQGFTVSGSVGFSDGDAFDNVSDGGIGSNYTDYSIGVSKEMYGLGFSLSYTGTDNDGDDLFGDLTDEWLFSVSKSL